MASWTNGFPSRLIYEVFYPNGPQTRLIPEMSFSCNATITGFTAALRGQNESQSPMIQVWRENSSQPGHYYKRSDGIAINNASCVGGLTEVFTDSGVFHCNLNQSTKGVSVEPGDILGLELPYRSDNNNIGLAFARVSGESITNFGFTSNTSSPVALLRCNWTNQMIPQITLDIESGESITHEAIG